MAKDEKLPSPIESEDFDDEAYARAVIEKWGKPIPKQWDNDKLKFFRAVDHQPEIKALARGLTIEEALNYYGLLPSVLPDYDALFFVTTFLQGRMKAKSDAVAALFTQMKGDKGTQASLAYLNRFATLFQGENAVDDGIRAIKIEVVE